MKNLNFFFTACLIFFLSGNQVYSTNVLQVINSDSRSGGGCGTVKRCKMCTNTQIIGLTLIIKPSKFPFKISNISAVNASPLGMDINNIVLKDIPEILGPTYRPGRCIKTVGIHSNRIIKNDKDPLLDEDGNLIVIVSFAGNLCLKKNYKPTSNFKMKIRVSTNYYNSINKNPTSQSKTEFVHDTRLLYNPCDDTLPYYEEGSPSPGTNIGPLLKIAESGKGLTQIAAYPNPFSENLLVSVNSKQKRHFSVELINSFGKKVVIPITQIDVKRGATQFKIKITNIRPGIYYLRLMGKEENHTLKIIKSI